MPIDSMQLRLMNNLQNNNNIWCNIDCTNHMEGVELYTLGAMDVVCQICGAIVLKPKSDKDRQTDC